MSKISRYTTQGPTYLLVVSRNSLYRIASDAVWPVGTSRDSIDYARSSVGCCIIRWNNGMVRLPISEEACFDHSDEPVRLACLARWDVDMLAHQSGPSG